MSRQYQDDLKLALAAAAQADQISLKRFQAIDLKVETKPDLTPVTDADKGVEEAFRKIIAAERPDDLIIGDKNAILVTSRILAFGPEYNVTINDPEEREPVETVVDLSKIQIKEVDESLLNRKNEYDFILPVSKTPIKFKLLTHGDELAINRDVEASEKTLKQGNEITARYRRIIVEVDGKRDLGTINNFVSNRLLAGDSKALRKAMQEISPDVDLTFDYTSPFSGETEALKIPIGIDFFYPTD